MYQVDNARLMIWLTSLISVNKLQADTEWALIPWHRGSYTQDGVTAIVIGADQTTSEPPIV